MQKINKNLTPKIIPRLTNPHVLAAAQKLGLTPLQAQLVANRLTTDQNIEAIVKPKLSQLQSPAMLLGAEKAGNLIADAVVSKGLIVLATDYDTDGVTSAWVARTALIDYFGLPESRVQQIIGERKSGYGITDEVVDRILELNQPVSLVISADQGSSDEPRIARLKENGISVCVTDHHQIPEQGIPESALCTVNPQQAHCEYDKTIAGCFVIFLVMTQVRQALIQRKYLPADTPSLKGLLMNVALGTVADSVSLQSPNNRAVVLAGLQQINQFQSPAWQAMRQLNPNNQQPIDAEYLGFQVATRINAASRVSDVTTAYRFLTAKSLEEANYYLKQLDTDNLNRRQQQTTMLSQASEIAQSIYHPGRYSLAIKMQGNAGIQGIIASRIGERYGVPTVAMTLLEDGYLAGSGRGIVPEIDLRKAFQTIEDRHPGMFKSMGGHAGAAGCMIPAENYENFATAFEHAIQLQLGDEPPYPFIETDGELQPWQFTPALIEEINSLQPFGRAWPSPTFSGEFVVDSVRVIGKTKTHLSFKLRNQQQQIINAIYFNALDSADSTVPFAAEDTIQTAFEPTLNHFMNQTSLQLRILSAYKKS